MTTIADVWTILERDEVGSTNDEARGLPAWQVVRADRQFQGRGRHGRGWVSGKGGLWMSAVVPTPGPIAAWKCLPLAAGLAVLRAVRHLGVEGVRLRWPNDVLVEHRKLAGLLVEQFEPSVAVVGLGLNITNRPAEDDSALGDSAVALVDLVPQTPSPARTAEIVLEELARTHAALAGGGLEAIAKDLAACWEGRRDVLVTLTSGAVIEGYFEGVDANGRLLLSTRTYAVRALPAHEVLWLRETQPPA